MYCEVLIQLQKKYNLLFKRRLEIKHKIKRHSQLQKDANYKAHCVNL